MDCFAHTPMPAATSEALAELEMEMPPGGGRAPRGHAVEPVAVIEAEKADRLYLDARAEAGGALQIEEIRRRQRGIDVSTLCEQEEIDRNRVYRRCKSQLERLLCHDVSVRHGPHVVPDTDGLVVVPPERSRGDVSESRPPHDELVNGVDEGVA